MSVKKKARRDLSHINRDIRPLARSVARLIPDPLNARLHDERNLDAIRDSLEAHGQQKPIVLRADGKTVIAGSGTLAAAKALGWHWIAAVKFDRAAEAAEAYGITDNRTAELASWDPDALASLVQHYEAAGDLALLPGWSEDEVKDMLSRTGPDTPDDFPAVDEATDQECPSCGYTWKGTAS